MRVLQFEIPGQGRRVGVVEEERVRDLTALNGSIDRVFAAFEAAVDAGLTFETFLEELLGSGDAPSLCYEELLAGRADSGTPFLHPPLDHADPHYVLVSGTGLTHTGGMKSRNQMHTQAESETASRTEEPQTDSAKMFAMGLADGKPADGQRGAMPEWFYKGNGTTLRGPGETVDLPAFALDGGEEPELVGCYIIDRDAVPRRLGFALGVEWSDHETEQINYLYLAPSKLRTCAVGPELITDCEFSEVNLDCMVQRQGETIYESGPLKSGEDFMCHSLQNCEDHHFKYPQHRVPGDVHLHFFGTSKLSYSTRDWKYQAGDVVTVSAEGLSAALTVVVADAATEAGQPVRVSSA
ncbi:MAG: GguC family protein [Planctomycetaceae bacterium]|jgi:hypothetical protein|nr:GguC family protein [Planctomycetaceae bacterium]